MNYKLNLSTAMLSVLGIGFMYLNTMAGFWFLVGVLILDTKEEVKINLLEFFVVRLALTLFSAFLAWGANIYTWLIDLFTDNYETISKLNKFNFFRIANGWMTYVNLLVVVAFLLTTAKKKVVKVPTVYTIVTKAMKED